MKPPRRRTPRKKRALSQDEKIQTREAMTRKPMKT